MYTPELTRAVRRSLYRLRWKLGRAWGTRVVLVGGLVPPFLVPDPPSSVPPHVGTSDIDLAVGLFASEEDAYVSLARALTLAGFSQRGGQPSFRWFADERGVEVVLEVLCPEDPDVETRIRRKVEADGGTKLTAFQVRGVELAARDYIDVQLVEQVEDLGDRGPIPLRVVGPATLLALKAQALSDIAKDKHAYDIVWLCDAWAHEPGEPHGARSLAAAVGASSVWGDPFIRSSMALMRELFAAPTAPGPVGYAREMSSGEPDGDERYRLYAYGLLQTFFDALSAFES